MQPLPHILLGTWIMLKAEASGEPSPELLEHNIELELQTGHYIVRFAGEITDRGTCQPGPTAPLATLQLTGTTGTNAGRHIPCLYQVAGDRLRICFGLDGLIPTGFTTAQGQARYLAVYRRKA